MESKTQQQLDDLLRANSMTPDTLHGPTLAQLFLSQMRISGSPNVIPLLFVSVRCRISIRLLSVRVSFPQEATRIPLNARWFRTSAKRPRSVCPASRRNPSLRGDTARN